MICYCVLELVYLVPPTKQYMVTDVGQSVTGYITYWMKDVEDETARQKEEKDDHRVLLEEEDGSDGGEMNHYSDL